MPVGLIWLSKVCCGSFTDFCKGCRYFHKFATNIAHQRIGLVGLVAFLLTRVRFGKCYIHTSVSTLNVVKRTASRQETKNTNRIFDISIIKIQVKNQLRLISNVLNVLLSTKWNKVQHMVFRMQSKNLIVGGQSWLRCNKQLARLMQMQIVDITDYTLL